MTKFHSVEARRESALARALAAAAQELQRLTENLQSAASTAEATARWHRQMAQIPAMMDALQLSLDEGESEEAAIAQVAARYEALPDSVAAWWRSWAHDSARMRRWRRDRFILQRAWAGATNAEIASQTKLHHKTVSRIIGQHLRANRKGYTLAPPSEAAVRMSKSVPPPPLIEGR